MTNAATAVTSYVDPTSPIFSTLEPSFHLTEHSPSGDLILSPRYSDRLSKDNQAYILELCRLGHEKEAGYAASCCTRGMILYRCPSGDYAKAVLHSCHDPGCRFCGRGYSRLLTWARTHNTDRILAEHIQAFEISATERLPRSRFRSLLRRFTDSLGPECSFLIHEVVDPSSVTKCRVAIHGRPFTILKLRSLLTAACPSWYATECRQDDPRKKLEWTFSGLEPMLLLDGILRAQARASLKGFRLVRCLGSHFRPMTPTELEAFNLAHSAHKDGELCPKCRLYELEHVPLEKRITLPVEEIESLAEVINWSGGMSPFHSQRVIANRAHSDKFQDIRQWPTSYPSSPPN
jgi:hypothetical protein